MNLATKTLPAYLKAFVAEQNYEKYTSRDHAAWRFIMRQNRSFFSQHAVPIYAAGLKKTGISIDQIPRISEMDQCLSAFGWGAVPVRGFIPPAAFLDFQARGVLPIASDMRTAEHIAYTPAPDIVHEAAGHAPIIADPLYAKYLHRYARMAQKAIYSLHDVRSYEAIRYLSDIKENPDTKAETIAIAEKRLKDVSAEGTDLLSENAKVVRMSWWTVEYGLVGKIEKPLIYGAGLLSSVGESQNCLSPTVKKIPLTIDCIYTSYDITEPQPQLFVTPSLEHLIVVLEELESTMAFVRGGTFGLEQAKAAATVNTIALDSGIALSGKLVEFRLDAGGEPSFVKCAGPVQLAFADQQLKGQGRERHPEGFSSPIGKWRGQNSKPAETLSDSDLRAMGLICGQKGKIEFESGFRVSGTLIKTTRESGKLIALTWRDCTVKVGEEVTFDPSWGEFDMIVGNKIVSVFGGPADRAQFGDLDIGTASSVPGRMTPYSPSEKDLFSQYEALRKIRNSWEDQSPAALKSLSQASRGKFKSEWLFALELYEVALEREPSLATSLESDLTAYAAQADLTVRELIFKGLALAKNRP